MASAYYNPPPPGAPYHHPPSSSSNYYYPPPPPPPPGATPPPPAQFPYDPYQPPPPPPAYGAYYDYPEPSRDELRTLFIAGLPGDSKPREVYNLFRDFPGYVSSHLRNSGKSSQAYAFAVFADQQSALAALHAVNGMVFDLEKNSSLHVDLAKSNPRSKRLRADDALAYSSDKKARNTVSYSRGFPDSGAGSNIHMSGMGNSAHSLNGYPSAQSHSQTGTALGKDPSTFVPQNNPPCPTLFIANLGPTCSEQELTEVFSRCTGFVKLKMQNKFGAPVAFVDFKDVDSSTEALNHLQGTILYSSDGEGMRLEYAKSRMGLRKREKSRLS